MKPRSEVEARVALTRDALAHARQEVTQARVAYAEADGLWIESGNKRANEKRRDASDALERAEILAKRAEALHDEAGVELAQLDREDALVALERLKAKLAAFDATVAAHAAEFVALDRQVNDRVFAVATELRDAQATFDEAVRLADELRIPMASGHRPDLANCSLAVRRALGAARKADDRDPLAQLWMAAPPEESNWRLRGTSQSEVDSVTSQMARARHEEEQARTFRAGFAAATAKPGPTPPTGNGDPGSFMTIAGAPKPEPTTNTEDSTT